MVFNAAYKSQDLLNQPGLERASTGMGDQRTTSAATQGDIYRSLDGNIQLSLDDNFRLSLDDNIRLSLDDNISIRKSFSNGNLI